MKFTETYRCCAISTAMLTDDDRINIINPSTKDMVMVRDTGFFMKLYEELSYVHLMINPLSAPLKHLILEAYHQGFRMVEFDADAPKATGCVRADKAAVALGPYISIHQDDFESVIDLVTDTRHWCNIRGINFNDVLRSSNNQLSRDFTS